MLTLIIQKIRQSLRLDRAVRFVWQAAPGLTIANLALVLIRGALPLLTLYLMKLIIDAVTFAVGAPDKVSAFQHVALLIGFAAGVALLNALLQSIAGLVKEAQTLAVTDHMYDILHAKSIEVDLEYYENPEYLDTLHRAQREGPSRPNQILNGLVQLGQSGISMVAMVGLLFFPSLGHGSGSSLCSNRSRPTGTYEVFRGNVYLAARTHPSGTESKLL